MKLNLIVIELAVLDKWKTIGQIENDKLGRQGRADYAMVKATCMHIANDRVVYMVGYGFFFVLELNMKDIFVELPK